MKNKVVLVVSLILNFFIITSIIYFKRDSFIFRINTIINTESILKKNKIFKDRLRAEHVLPDSIVSLKVANLAGLNKNFTSGLEISVWNPAQGLIGFGNIGMNQIADLQPEYIINCREKKPGVR